MKTIKYSLSLGLLLSLASCADDQIVDFKTEKPESIAQYEYLNAYDALKTYIDRSASPDFKLGIALSASDFLKGEMVRAMAISNFDEMTAGNAMKYASCVNDKGDMDFATVEKFVSSAQAAGMTIYGHTLAWHAQQNNKYLNSLIQPIIIPGVPDVSGNKYLHIVNPTAANNWDGQLYCKLLSNLQQGQKYNLSFRAKAENPFKLNLWVMTAGSEDKYGIPEVGISDEWDDYSVSFTPDYENGQNLKLIFGHYAGWWDIDNMVLTADGDTENLIDNGDFETGETTNWEKYAWHAFTYSVETESSGGGSGGYCLKITNTVKQTDNWRAQAWYKLSEPLSAGVEYTLTAMGKASDPYSSAVFLQCEATGTQEYKPSLVFGQTWEEVKISFTLDGSDKDKVTLNFGDFVGTLFLDNVKLVESGSNKNLIDNSDFEAGNANGWNSNGYHSLSSEGEGYVSGGTPDQIIEKTPEEKKEYLTEAMNSWVEGMMKATAGYVTTWDVVNEAIFGDGKEEFYPLQSASNVSAEDAKNNFYWQDYLGSEDYVRIVVAAARKYYAENGGTAPLKLFVNDYNLESWWDGNKKARSLVHWIETWEADGVTKIDGIGTQMHVSYILKEEDQKAQEDAIVKMFQILAESGKLIKISELDMGIVDKAFGTALKTEDVTFEQYLKMAEFYRFIISKYFEIIPVAQQYGITQWCATDSGWRGGEPVGLWGLDYNRKPTYAGFADGLAGK